MRRLANSTSIGRSVVDLSFHPETKGPPSAEFEEFFSDLLISKWHMESDIGRGAIYRPPPKMSVPDWADEYRHLSSAVGAVGGPWQTSRVEVARGPMMAVTEPGVRVVTAMTCTQTLKTELLTNTFGYYAHLDPSPMLLLEPKDEMASAFSKERLTPMINSSPALRAIMGDRKSRTSDDTIQYKQFPGGFLAISSAGSPSNLAMRAIRVVLLDEIDKYETTKEGDPVTLAEERMATFFTSSLAIRACSPTWVETSRIYRSYLESDQRRPFCACPHCGHWQSLDFFKHVEWEKDEDGTHKPETAAIYCEGCGAAWSEADRVRMCTTRGAIRHYQTREFTCNCRRNSEGEPVVTKHEPMVDRCWDWDEEHQVGYATCPDCGERRVSNYHAGFQVSKLYSPFTTIVALAKKWMTSSEDPELKQTFFNTQLGIPYQAEVSKAVDKHWLASRREMYQAPVPEGVLVLTAGLDVQSGGSNNEGRVEVELVGWGLGEESWSIETEVFYGDPAKPDVWAQVDEYLLKGFRHQRGFELFISAACIDSGGGATQDVYNFARPRVGRNVWAIKGASDKSGQWSPIWPAAAKEARHQKYRTGFKPVILGVNAAKESIRQRLLIKDAGPGYCHFSQETPESWLEQLTSEQLIIEKRMGVRIRSWRLPKGVANEGLDCRVYAYAALQGLYHTRRFNMDRQFEMLSGFVAPPPDAPAPIPQPPKRRIRSGL